ncbi:UNVERIFIED_CONTAM: tRNA (N6-threonylcarbamoyladenosine(37)-N6)-methyltransferase TrmO [Clostridioides difficile]|uniref:SAM-dependent methyltransferase n=1 Tax=Clostridioides difficile TaxID=1496 RepID=UPI000825B1C4|nr:SAM-dependent methyltransferase [Clostridioides difficile]MBY1130546.1 SAM-dependent methyltransferase [Clostridioides difficile]MBY1885459.1 SAM-dependent methyltransferase [Clostridioides difficile]MBZ0779453.1 SAM-dependent methyltransferase [Clostridioides difficile]MBZ0856111.1 SAM-dependent methyltransferase [Clostridioides difficile]MCG7699660.1 SAM-dependent methyltransferase [Clostridioides difficile]
MKEILINPIGKIRIQGEEVFIKLDKKYVPALNELDDFSHLNVFWWADGFDNPELRSILETPKPYKSGPDVIGIFATRSPIRPNPIALTTVQIINIDHENGIIKIPYIDANDNSPVIDLKPYTPSVDRVENPSVPKWCSHWPKSVEKSGEFNWENEIEF